MLLPKLGLKWGKQAFTACLNGFDAGEGDRLCGDLPAGMKKLDVEARAPNSGMA